MKKIYLMLVWGVSFLSLNTTFAHTKKPFIILVSGGSASGKTFTAKKIIEALQTPPEKC
jgi:pantothenate kinase-related protein Tda10